MSSSSFKAGLVNGWMAEEGVLFEGREERRSGALQTNLHVVALDEKPMRLR